MKLRGTRPEQSGEMKARWQNPEYRRQQVAIRQSPERCVRSSEKMKAKWADPVFAARVNAAKQAGRATPEYRQKRSAMTRALWADPEYKDKTLRAQRRGCGVRPTSIEVDLQSILDRHFPGEWKYVGDGQVWLGGRNPDFINVNGHKAIIEAFGSYWHEPEEVDLRTQHFRQFGFSTLVLWDTEIKNEVDVVARVTSMVEGCR